MPGCFLGQAFDLGDPWAKGCMETKACFGWDTPWSFNRTCWYEISYIHPRDKAPLGQRLANAALSVHYNRTDVHTQPVISGCSLTGSASAGQRIVVAFDPKRMGKRRVIALILNIHVPILPNAWKLIASGWTGDDQLLVQKFDTIQQGASATEVFNTVTNDWTFVHKLLPGENASSFIVVVQPGVSAGGIRYAWADNPCCGTNNRTIKPCPPASCPLITKRTKEPAVPWQATIDARTKQCVLRTQ